jgi:hypothetical protein
MQRFSCAIAAQQSGEDLIGTAGHFQTYVLIECPLPWAAKVFDSKQIPLALREYVKAVTVQRSVQFLCINRGSARLAKPAHMSVLIYERASWPSSTAPLGIATADFASNYRGYEFQLASLDQVVPCLEAFWQRSRQSHWHIDLALPFGGHKIDPSAALDVLVCTHGSRDKCCAQFGQPFFRAAKQMVDQGYLPNTRVWRASHIGGHRFAPTAISLPDGRYYGRLTLSALSAIATRSGPVDQLRAFYRGWGLLPPPLQVLERQLWLSYGWSWLNYQVACDSLITKTEDRELAVKLYIKSAESSQSDSVCHATLVRDPQQVYCVKASCNSAMPSIFEKYSVAEYTIVKSAQSLAEYPQETVSIL